MNDPADRNNQQTVLKIFLTIIVQKEFEQGIW